MNLRSFVPTLALLMLLAACGRETVAGDDPSSPDAFIDALMQRYAGDVPGAAVLVIRDGQPVFRKSYGMAELETGRPATADTHYRLASVSKQFTAAAILLLAEDGKLSIDDPVRRWLPSLPPAADAITIRHLLSHTGGLVDYEDLMPAGQTAQLHDIDVLRLLEREDRLYFAPGSDYRYSNSGYALLALIVGEASGQDFAGFLRQHIFLPMGMDGTYAHQDGVDEVPERAYGYSSVDGRWQRTDQSLTSAVLGDGGIYSSVDELAKWDAALYDERLLKAESLRMAFSPATVTPEPHAPHYGFGWRIDGDMLWHSGESIGFRNVILRLPDQRLTVIVLTNRNGPEPYDDAVKIADLYLPTEARLNPDRQ